MEFEGHLDGLQGRGVTEDVLDPDWIILGHDQEGWGRVGGGIEVGSDAIALVGDGQVARVNEDSEIRATRESIGGVESWISASISGRAQRSGEVAAGGKTEHPDAFGIYSEFWGALAQEAHGALGILKRGGMFLETFAPGHAVFEQGAGDADGIEPFADLGAFEIEGQDVVPTPGADQHGGAGILGFLGSIKGEGRLGDVAQTHDPFAGDEVFVGLSHVAFLADIPFFAWGGGGPDWEGRGRSGVGGSHLEGEQQGE